jgi:CheY-like chemotaxis protein
VDTSSTGAAALQKVQWIRSRSFLRRLRPLACFFETKGEKQMAEDTVLYISDHGPRGSSIMAALEAIGYGVVTTDSSTQAIALLFVMHSVTAVVLDQHSIEQSNFDLTHNLRELRPDVPLILLCADRIDHLPPEVDLCVNTGRPLENITADLKRILEQKPAPAGPVDCCGCASPEHIDQAVP